MHNLFMSWQKSEKNAFYITDEASVLSVQYIVRFYGLCEDQVVGTE